LFDAAASIQDAATTEGITGHAAALRWAMFHSALKPENGDAVVIGVSSPEQLSQNLDIARSLMHSLRRFRMCGRFRGS
jgi:aflatoxin B1 aldehyde reductase